MRLNKLLLFLVSFVVVAFGQPAFVPFLGLVAAAVGYGLFWKGVVDYPSKRGRFFIALAWYTGVQAIQLSWMSATEYQGVYILFVHAGLSLFLGVQFALFTLFIRKENSVLAILALSSLWTLIEWSRFFIFCGFSFNQAGMALSAHIWPLQSAAVFGILGLSFYVMCVNQMALRALFLRRFRIVALLALFPYLLGFALLSYHEKKRSCCDKTVSILLVQTGLLPSEKVALSGRLKDFVSPYEQWKRILRMVKEQEGVEIVVLPEAALPFHSKATPYLLEKVKKIFQDELGERINVCFPACETTHVSNCFWVQTLSNYLGAEVIIGLDHYDPEKQLNHNSALHFQPQKEEYNRYDKKILIPLAEYLPLKWLYPLVKNYGITDFFSQGKKSPLFHSKIPVAVTICYEDTFPYLVRQGRLKKAELLINLTNDGWYPRSKLACQHFDHARLRAVENGVCLARCCNTGITAAIDSSGQIISRLPELDEEERGYVGALKVKINLYHYLTLYTFWGNWGIICPAILLISFFLILKIGRFIKEKIIEIARKSYLS